MGRDLSQFTAVKGEGAPGAEGDHKTSRHLLQFLDGLFQAVRLRPAQCLRLVAENKVQSLADDLDHPVPEEFDHTWIRKTERRFHPGGLRQFPRLHRRGPAGGGGDQVALDINVLGSGNRLGIQLLARQGLADPEEGIHAALGVGGDQHQALASGPLRALGLETVVHPRGLEIGDIDIPIGIVGHLAAHKRRPAELGGGNH